MPREAQLTIYRHPEEIKSLAAGERGPKDLSKPVKLPKSSPQTGPPIKAATKLWAAFFLSGPG